MNPHTDHNPKPPLRGVAAVKRHWQNARRRITRGTFTPQRSLGQSPFNALSLLHPNNAAVRIWKFAA